MDAPWEMILEMMKDLEKGQKAIAADLGEVKAEARVAYAAAKEIAEKVEKHERIIRGGNGDGLGLSAMVKQVCNIAEDDHKLLNGTDQNPGLKGRLKIAEDGLEILAKFGYVIGGAIFTSALGVAVLILTHQIHIP